MATINIAARNITETTMEIRAYYGGTAWANEADLRLDGRLEHTYRYSDSGSIGNRDTWTTAWYKVTGLRAGREFEFEIKFYDSNNNLLGTGTKYFTTDSGASYPRPNTPNPFITSHQGNVVTFGWSSDSDAMVFVIEVEDSRGNLIANSSTSGTSYTIYLETPGDYTLYVAAIGYGDLNSGWGSRSFTITEVIPDPPIIYIEWFNHHEVNISWSKGARALDTEINVYSAYYNEYQTTADYVYKPTDFTFGGLSPNTRYSVRGRSIGSTSNSAWTAIRQFTTGDSPWTNWAWNYTIKSGGNFYSTSGKTAYLMTASHWNDFTAAINLKRSNNGLGAYTFTTARGTTTSAVLRECVNEAIRAINAMLVSSQRMTEISTGNKVTAKIFLDLRDKLNAT